MSLRLWWALLWIDANMEHTSLQTSNLHLSIHPSALLSIPPSPRPGARLSSSSICILHAGSRTAALCGLAANHACLSVLQMFTMFTHTLWRHLLMQIRPNGLHIKKQKSRICCNKPASTSQDEVKEPPCKTDEHFTFIPPVDITDCTKAEGENGVFHPLCWIMRSHSIMCPSTAELCLWKWKLTRSLKQGDLPTWMSRGCRNLFFCCPKQKNLDEAGGGSGGSTEKKRTRIERWLA